PLDRLCYRNLMALTVSLHVAKSKITEIKDLRDATRRAAVRRAFLTMATANCGCRTCGGGFSPIEHRYGHGPVIPAGGMIIRQSSYSARSISELCASHNAPLASFVC